jgi:hypothetical protein
MSPRPTAPKRAITDLAVRIGIDPGEAERAIALARSGNSDLIAKVMAGRMTVRQALAAAKAARKEEIRNG